MNDIKNKWQNDKKFRALVKLLLYILFMLGTVIFINTSKATTPLTNETNNDNFIGTDNNNNNNIIKLPNNYECNIEIIIDNNNYQYLEIYKNNKKNIIKTADEKITNYIYQAGNYYVEDDDNYIITTKEDVYDIINYNYLNIDNINMFLSKATKNGNQYLVYLKDIILDNDSDIYFVIDINNDRINIDYTPLMKEYNPLIEKYKVNIDIKEIE